jgi:hypothetical protein
LRVHSNSPMREVQNVLLLCLGCSNQSEDAPC